ncbi:MAG: hypothetical protein DSY80_06905 [Desulfocapsa sp.]|nr:MAG: hypothetical protein DSY80_06905 [Desulfocapsa sp.]
MSAIPYHHGARVVNVDDGLRSIKQVQSSVIGAVVTAPSRDVSAFPLNTPIQINGDTSLLKKLGAAGTARDVCDDILDQGAASIMLTCVDEGADEAAMWSNVVGSQIHKTGMYALLKAPTRLKVTPKLLIAPGFTSGVPTDGLADIVVNDGGQGYTNASINISGNGEGASASPIIQNGSIVGATINNAGHGYDEINLTVEGDGTGAQLSGALDDSANPVTAELVSLANKLRAAAFVDGPNTTNEDAVAYRNQFGAKRLMVIDPYVKVWDAENNINVTRPSAARAVGIQSYMDNEHGFWWSLSNQEIVGVTDVARDVYYDIGDVDTEANYLNRNGVTTVVHDNGYRFSGLRTCSQDPQWQFMSSVRVTDNIHDSMIQSFKWAKDRPMSAELLDACRDMINDHLSGLKAQGAILGGRAVINPDVNPKDQIMDGIFRIDFDHEPPPPFEQAVIASHRNSYYLEQMVADILKQSGSALAV